MFTLVANRRPEQKMCVTGRFLLILFLVACLSSLSLASSPEEEVSLSGWFTVIWNDRTRYFLIDDQGRSTELLMNEEIAKPLGGLLALNRKRVKIVGERVAESPGTVRVVSITFE